MLRRGYSVIDDDYLNVSFRCVKCSRLIRREGIIPPDCEETLTDSITCKCGDKYDIQIVDKSTTGEIIVPQLPDDVVLEVEGILFEEYNDEDLSLLYNIINSVGFKITLNAIESLDERVKDNLYRLLFIQLIANMDFYLREIITRKILNSPKYTCKYVEYKFKGSKQERDISKTSIAKKTLKKESFQNMNNVIRILNDVLGICVPNNSFISEAVSKRNAFVHKNSMKKRKEIKVTKEYLLSLKAETDSITQSVREKISELEVEEIIKKQQNYMSNKI